MVGPEAIWDPKNLRRAWRWTRSNADASYKLYFRQIYSNYSVVDAILLSDLRDRLRRGVYQARVATKIFLPKPSGILRPYTLLATEDQLAYQAAVNVIADQLFPRVRHRYLVSVFGHLYAGRSSTWFYRRWQDGFSAFNKAATAAFNDGLVYAASFDLTAFYDSIDHGVLRHFLGKIGCSPELSGLLSQWLSRWTATEKQIFHNHGIPQGPLPSGLLAETVLTHMDDGAASSQRVKYFRYVDDIRLFARTETDLRKTLVGLDRLSKDIGLFPQSSKISIHRVTDIRAELKTISQPAETTDRDTVTSQRNIYKRLVRLSPRYEVKDTTRFKYVLGSAMPRARLTDRLWRVYETEPHLYDPIARYLMRYDRLPRRVASRLSKEIRRQTLYHAIAAAFVRAATGRVSGADLRGFRSTLKRRWQPRVMQADLASAILWALAPIDGLTEAQHEYAIRSNKAWWVRAQAVLALRTSSLSPVIRARLANVALTDDCNDVAVAAAWVCGTERFQVTAPRRRIRGVAKEILKEFGLVRRGGPRECHVGRLLNQQAGTAVPSSWRHFFRSDYRSVERQLVAAAAYSTTDATSWFNCMDVFNDWLLIALYRRDTTLGQYGPGSIGSVMNSKRLHKHYPAIGTWIQRVHQLRCESQLSHAKQKRTGRPTRAIKFQEISRGRRLLAAAVSELSKTF